MEAFSRLRGFGENVRPFITRLRVFFVCFVFVCLFVFVLFCFVLFCFGVFFCLFVLFCFEVEISPSTLIPLFMSRISPQWLSEQRRLRPNVP